MNIMSHFLLVFAEGCLLRSLRCHAIHSIFLLNSMFDYFQKVKVWNINLGGLCQFMTNGEVLHYTLSFAGEQVCFIHNLVDSNRLLRLGNWSRYYSGPRHAERTGRNKLCTKGPVSFSLRQRYMGYNVSLPKATINFWLQHIQMFIFAWLKCNDTLFWDTIVPLAHIGITRHLGKIYPGLGWT